MTYDTMGLSNIEGIDQFYARFTLLVTNLKKKPYDALDHRKQDFDIDYQEFKVQHEELNVSNNSLPSTCSLHSFFFH